LDNFSSRTFARWRNYTSEKVLSIEERILNRDNRKRLKVKQPFFRQLEDELLKRRLVRVTKNRDRSYKWLRKEAEKIIGNETEVEKLNLNEQHKKLLPFFNISDSWMRKLIHKSELSLKSKHSDRKLTVEKYLLLRKIYLPKERKFWRQVNCSVNNYECFVNADEIPFDLSINLKQISAPNERVQVVAPPIIGIGKYRYGTIVPFIAANGTVYFVCIILKGGITIGPKLSNYVKKMKYKNILVFANIKAYMNNKLWVLCMAELMKLTKTFRYGNVYGASKIKQNILFYSDNCQCHSTDTQRRKNAIKGIFERNLIPNATHIQQSIDQHLGLYLKRIIKTV
jgi:hypothetical protein